MGSGQSRGPFSRAVSMPDTFYGTTRNNELLEALQIAIGSRLAPCLEKLELKAGCVVWDGGEGLTHAYFPRGAVLSFLAGLKNGSTIETAHIGHGGAFGLLAVVYGRVTFSRCVVRRDGGLVRCPVEALRSKFRTCAPVRDLIFKYSKTSASQVQQSAV